MPPPKLHCSYRDSWVNLQIRTNLATHGFTPRTTKLVKKLKRIFYTTFPADQRKATGDAAKATNFRDTGDTYGRVAGAGPWAMENSRIGRTPANWVVPAAAAIPPGALPGHAVAPQGNPVAPPASAAPQAAAIFQAPINFAIPAGDISAAERIQYVNHPERSSNSGRNSGPTLREINIAKAHRIPLRAPLGDGWEDNASAELLGAGGFGIVRILRRYDEDGHVTDRVLVKDNVFMQHENMFSYARWHGDVRDPQARRPMEIWAMQYIHDRPGSDKCTRLRPNFPPEMDPMNPMWYRIYMEYCENSTVDDLIDSDECYRNEILVPEPVLWGMFEDLVEACLLLRYGGVKKNEAVEDWEPIIHRDIKPENIFLDAIDRRRTDFPNYPAFRLGDFGLCVTTTDDALDNPMAFTNAGTEGWRAPEQLQYVHRKTRTPMAGPKMGEWTNVWCVGMVIIAMMNKTVMGFENSSGTERLSTAVPDRPTVDEGARDFYSHRLVALVECCTAYDIAARPRLRWLRRRIRRFTRGAMDEDDDGANDADRDLDESADAAAAADADADNYDEDAAQGMRAQKSRTSQNEIRLKKRREEYRLHVAQTGGVDPAAAAAAAQG